MLYIRAGALALATVWWTTSAVGGPGAGGGTEAYVIDSGDSVRVLAVGRQDLSGDFQIDNEGLLRIPTLRGVPSIGLTTVQVADQVREAILETYREPVMVGVGIAEYRPVFVIGEVRTPGQYDFRPGMTALQAVAVAGGFASPYTAAMSSGSGGEVAGLLAQHFVLSVQRARLLAEQNSRESLDLTSDMKAIAAGNPLFASVAAAEEELFTTHRAAQAQKLQGFEHSRELFEQEAAALARQIEAQERLRVLLDEQAAAVEGLVKKGAVDRIQYLDIERQATATHSDLQQSRAFLARAQQNASAMRQSAIDLGAQESASLESAISTNARDLIMLEERLKTLTGGQVDVASLARNDGSPVRGYTFEVIRTALQGNEEVIPTTRSGRIQPGDVISVARVPE